MHADLPALYRQILDHSSEIHWLLDCASGKLLYLSPAAERRFGYGAGQAQTLAARLLHDLPARLARFADGDRSRLRLLRTLVLSDNNGGSVDVEIESTLLTDPAGLPVALTGTVRDVSERNGFARQQKAFASMVSHQFRTPLATIDGAVQRLVMTGEQHDEATRKRYAKIQRGVEQLLAMMDEYLSPDRLAASECRRAPDGTDPLALLEAAAAQARMRRAALSVQADGLPEWLRCDPAGMRLCLNILLDNAIKYTASEVPVTLVGKPAAQGGIEFQVRDGGPGIPADEAERLFDKGFRGRAAAGLPGSGLGLYLARSVVEVHGGTLTVENFPASGKMFRIWLPFQAAGKSLAQADVRRDNSLMPAQPGK